MRRLAEFIRKHPCFFLKNSAHILWIRVSRQLRNLVQFQHCIDQKILDPRDPAMSHCLRKTPAPFLS